TSDECVWAKSTTALKWSRAKSLPLGDSGRAAGCQDVSYRSWPRDVLVPGRQLSGSGPEIGHSIDAQYRARRHAVRFPATGLRLSARLQASSHAVDSTTGCVESVA